MAEAYVDKVANELADLALADQAASGDIGIVDLIGEILGASSQSLQETYSTAIRVRRAEARAREVLAQRLANGYKAAPTPKSAPLQGLPEEESAAEEEPVADDQIDTSDDQPQTDVEQDEPAPDDPAPSAMPRRVTR